MGRPRHTPDYTPLIEQIMNPDIGLTVLPPVKDRIHGRYYIRDSRVVFMPVKGDVIRCIHRMILYQCANCSSNHPKYLWNLQYKKERRIKLAAAKAAKKVEASSEEN